MQDENIQSKGGKARRDALSADERKAIAKKAADARWSIPKATHIGELNIGERIIPCAVLENGDRILAARSLAKVLGVKGGGRYWERKKGDDGAHLPEYVSAKYLSEFISPETRAKLSESITYIQKNGGMASGIKASLLPDICDIWLKAKENGALKKPSQIATAETAYILLRGFAHVGIIALVDEATGYQYDRSRHELEEQLKRFLSDSLRQWVRTFPADYFKHLCRLRNVEIRPDMKLPQYFGKLTNNLVYRRLAPGILQKLKERRIEKGRPSNKLHSWLSEDIGLRSVLMHLGTVVGLMKINTDYKAFVNQLDQISPIYPDTPGLFDDPNDWDVPVSK